jgi:LytS/YehU family sensor histidine kinase
MGLSRSPERNAKQHPTHSSRTTALQLRRPSSRTLHTALIITGAWTVFGAIHALMWMATLKDGYSIWRTLIPVALVVAWGWALLTPVIYWLTRRLLPKRVGWPMCIAGHTIAAAVIAVTVTALRMRLITWMWGEPFPKVSSFEERIAFWSDVNLFTYLAIVSMGRAIDSFRRYLDRALRTHVLETQLARAQLHYLELQLQPHFLFNSLNAIQELAHEAPNAAERMLHKLRALLGLSLVHGGRDEVSLLEELASLQPYIDIQRTRFSDWLTVSFEIDDASRKALVPHLILQPLVENSIRHGLSVRAGPGHITIVARRARYRLQLEVRDNGVGISESPTTQRSGIGLRNTGDRLRQLYGADQGLILRDADGGGTVVEINIPYREAAATEQPPQSPIREGEPADTGARASVAYAEGIGVGSYDDADTADIDWRTGEFSTAQFVSLPARTTGGGNASSSDGIEGPSVRHATPASTPSLTIDTPPSRLGPRVLAAFIGLWLLMALAWTAQMEAFYVLSGMKSEPFSLSLLKLQLVGSAYWIAVSPLVLGLSRRLRVRPERWIGPLAIHVLVAIALSFGHLELTKLTQLSVSPILVPFNINPLTGNFFVYFGLVAWMNSRDFIAWYQAREVAAARLTAEIANSRFRALCVQLRPQFLLGTLELLAQLVHRDVWRAETLIARLADVLRRTLDSARDRSTTLRSELQLLTACVEAHKVGIRPNVHLELDVDGPAMGSSIPSRLVCTMADDLLAGETADADARLVISVAAERVMDATRIRIHGEAKWKTPSENHAWWRKKSVAEAAIADAGPLVSVTFPDRSTAVVIVADPPSGQLAGTPLAAAVAA